MLLYLKRSMQWRTDNENGLSGSVAQTHFTEDNQGLEQQCRTWKNHSCFRPGGLFCKKRACCRGVSLGSEQGSRWLPLPRHTPAGALLLQSALRSPAAQGSLPCSLGCVGCPTPSWLALPVFVIVVLALCQAWLRAILVGTVCTVSAEPRLSSYTINFFF